MSEATEAAETEAFARQLRELKDRSGLSYGTLAKRLHMSTSTLHRYCNGTAVPLEYAPVERLAKVCRATPPELVELHRRWILADAARGRKAEQPGEGDFEGDGENSEPVVVDVPREFEPSPRPRRRRTVLIASIAVAAVLGAVALTVHPPFLGGDDTADRQAVAGAGSGTTTGAADAGEPSAAPSASGKKNKPSASASASPTRSAGSGSGTSAGGDGQRETQPTSDTTATVPLTVGVRPYVYDSPCSQHFLVDAEPAQVGPPASEQDAQRWSGAYGAVSSNEQRIGLTVQGTGKESVVIEALHLRVLSKGAPLGWNEYAMGDGCGGGVETRSFDADLDSGSPTLTVKNGQRDFPYKVSESDPEVYYVTVHTKAHDVRWDLTLDWSSGSRHGTVHLDNNGTPFRTSAKVGGTAYVYPLGGSEWERDTNTN